MRSHLVTILAVIPLTAVLTAATTILVLHGLGVLPELRLDQSAPAVVPEVVAPSPAAIEPPAKWERAPEAGPGPLAAPEPAPLLVAAAIDTTVPVTANPEPTGDGLPTAAPNAPAADTGGSGMTLGSIDYFKLNSNLEHVSTALDRFNKKLLEALGQRKNPPTSNDDDGDDAIVLDERETQK